MTERRRQRNSQENELQVAIPRGTYRQSYTAIVHMPKLGLADEWLLHPLTYVEFKIAKLLPLSELVPRHGPRANAGGSARNKQRTRAGNSALRLATTIATRRPRIPGQNKVE